MEFTRGLTFAVGQKGKNMNDDLINRKIAYAMLSEYYHHRTETQHEALWDALSRVPSAEPLTDKEQRIFLAAMAREEKICKEVDAEMTREPYEDSLVKTCHEIIRKVKGALWTQ